MIVYIGILMDICGNRGRLQDMNAYSRIVGLSLVLIIKLFDGGS